MTVYADGVAEMYRVFKSAWDAGASAIAGYVPEVVYNDQPIKDHAALDAIFIRLSVRNLGEGQVGMGAAGGSLYETTGLLIIQLFIPADDVEGVSIGRDLSVLVRNAYRVHNGAVTFANATMLEQPPETRWRQTNISVEYDFTETT